MPKPVKSRIIALNWVSAELATLDEFCAILPAKRKAE